MLKVNNLSGFDIRRILTKMSGGGGTTPTLSLVNHIGSSLGQNGGSSPPIDTTGSNFLLIAGGSYSAGGGVTLTDSYSNTWVSAGSFLNTGLSSGAITLWYCASPTVGTGHTFTLGGTFNFAVIAVAAFNSSRTLVLAALSGNGSGGTTVQPGSITPANNYTLVATGTSHNNTNASTVDSPFTVIDSLASNGSSAVGVGLAYDFQTMAAALNPTWTNAGNGVVACMAAFSHFESSDIRPLVISKTLGSQRANFTGEVGFYFTVGANNITVTDLGRFTTFGNSNIHVITLYSGTSTASALGSVTVNTSGATPSSDLFGTLSSPITLTAGSTYYILSSEVSTFDAWYDDNTVLNPTSEVTINGSCFETGGTITPGTVTVNHSYVPVNFKFHL